MKIALLGYGKMGKMVEQLLIEDQQEIVAVIDNETDWVRKLADFQSADVAIDFSMPSVAVPNMLRAFEYHIPIVVGTTGWTEQIGYVSEACIRFNGSLVYGSNFSIGANLFMQLNRMLAELMNDEKQYSASMEETHHLTKKDAPSGTAIRLATDLLAHVQRLDHWELSEVPLNDPMALPIKAIREGSVPGIHKIRWMSEDDEIEILHSANNRKGFARGAVRAAYWLVQHPGVHDFQNIVLNI